jgi:hypothetical protein
MRVRAGIQVLLAALLLAGCGGSSKPGGRVPLSSEDQTAVRAALNDLDALTPDLDVTKDGHGDIAALVRIYRKNPNALYRSAREGTKTMRQVLKDEAKVLRDHPEYAEGLEKALRKKNPDESLDPITSTVALGWWR